jgi:hypothetical protein
VKANFLKRANRSFSLHRFHLIRRSTYVWGFCSAAFLTSIWTTFGRSFWLNLYDPFWPICIMCDAPPLNDHLTVNAFNVDSSRFNSLICSWLMKMTDLNKSTSSYQPANSWTCCLFSKTDSTLCKYGTTQVASFNEPFQSRQYD